MQVTVITPVAKHHEQQFVRCADSVRKQTIECRHLHMIDTEGKGPGFIRNKLLEQVKTKFVVFLDADDYLEPKFIEECIKVSQPHGYVFTDWYEGDKVKSTPKGAFWDTAWHLITCLIHTDMVRIVGGFSETMAAMEDTELFLKFDEYAYCGVQVREPLVHYTNEGKRSKDARTAKLIEGIKLELGRKYRVACCSDANNKNGARPAVGKKMPGDVQVVALWKGNMVTGGAVSGRRYQRASRPMKMWIDKRDAFMRPDLYRILPQKTKVDPPKAPKRRVLKKPRTFADMLHAAGMLDLPPGTENVLPVAEGEITPDFDKLNTIAQRIYHVESKPRGSVDTNSDTVVVKPGKPDRVRKPSAPGGNETGRQAVAIGNG